MGVVNQKALQRHNGRSKAFHSYVFIVCKYLLYNNQRVILLTLLYEEILTIDKILGCYWLIKGCEFFLVECYATALNELTHLTLTWEYLHTFLIEDINSRLSKDIL